ncbi:MAG: hypothetical protein ACM3RP_09270 [Chitinophagales bacterium]
MLMLRIYQGILAVVVVLVADAVLRQRDLGRQLTGGLVLVPLLLRSFLVK